MKKRYWLIGVFCIIAVLVVFVLPNKYTVPILMYHHVEECTQACDADTVSPETFEKHMALLREKKYNVMSLDDYVAQQRAGKSFPRNTVVVTFDDGYDDVYTYAFPILKKYHIPATHFIPPVDIGKDPRLTWSELLEMDRAGIKTESHSMTHVYLPGVTNPDQLWWELVESKKVLEEKLGRQINFISYPVGGFNHKIKTLVQKAGYQAAFATNRGYDRFNQDLFEINRIRPNDNDGALGMMFKLSGYYNLIRKLKKPN